MSAFYIAVATVCSSMGCVSATVAPHVRSATEVECVALHPDGPVATVPRPASPLVEKVSVSPVRCVRMTLPEWEGGR